MVDRYYQVAQGRVRNSIPLVNPVSLNDPVAALAAAVTAVCCILQSDHMRGGIQQQGALQSENQMMSLLSIQTLSSRYSPFVKVESMQYANEVCDLSGPSKEHLASTGF